MIMRGGRSAYAKGREREREEDEKEGATYI